MKAASISVFCLFDHDIPPKPTISTKLHAGNNIQKIGFKFNRTNKGTAGLN
jgi:hypothetical protein